MTPKDPMTPEEATAGADPTARDELERPPLHEAALTGNEDTVRLLIEKGADPTARGELERPPLHEAALTGNEHTVRLLIEKGADPTARGEHPKTRPPLHEAALTGNEDTARLLIDEGADPTVKNQDPKTQRHWAAEQGHTDLVKMLQDAAKDQQGHAGRVAKQRGSDKPPQIGG
jgi:ankyrin repeat protein